MIAAAAVGAAAIGVVCHGAFHRNSPVFGSALGRLPGDGRRIALTFDDGPNPAATPAILDVLQAEGVRATFFLLGRHVERWPEIAARVAAEGHEVANHGYYHRKLELRSPSYVREDLGRGTESIVRASGLRPRFFRAPHGFRSPWVTPIARSLGQRTIGWTLGVWDSDRPGVETIARRALHGSRPGTILLLHDGDGYDPDGDRMQTATALPLIIRGLRELDFAFAMLPA